MKNHKFNTKGYIHISEWRPRVLALEKDLAEARAEIKKLKINSLGDLDLLAADTEKMNAMQDKLDAKDKLIKQMREFIANLAEQKTTDEMTGEYLDNADFEGGYDYIVKDARRIKAALEAAERGE